MLIIFWQEIQTYTSYSWHSLETNDNYSAATAACTCQNMHRHDFYIIKSSV